MKLQKLMFTFMVVLLSASLLNTGNVNAVPNTNFETGDYFHYNSDETRNEFRQYKIVLANDANPSQLYRYEERNDQDDETVEGDLELFLILPGANLPPFTNPDGDFDHLLLVDWEGVTVTPSTHTSWENFLDGGDPNCQSWCNSTVRVDDTTGRYRSNDEGGDDENAEPVVSNATYLIQFSEMTDNTYYFDELQNMGPGDQSNLFGNFNSEIPLTSRSVTVETNRPYTINSAIRNIDTRIVSSTFGVSYQELYNTSVTFGDPNDPNSSPIDVEANLDIYVNYMFEYYFDATTGMLLETREDRDYSVDLGLYNANTTNPGSDPGCTSECGPQTMSIDMQNSWGGNRFSSNVIDEASSFYGNTRPTSSGNNRIEEGDLLVYDSEDSKEYSFDSDMIVGDSSTTGWESYDSNWGYGDSYGTASFDVYRHQPGSWDAVMAIESTGEGENGYDSSGTHQGNSYADADTSTWGPEDNMDFDYMTFQSTDDEEIVHFFDDNQHFDDDFLYDDGDKDGDGWRLNYERDLPKLGVVNDSTWHIDLPADEIFQINGFDRTWFDVQMYGQDYSRTYNQVVEIPVTREDDWEIWMNVTLTGDAEGSQDWFYDANTGVLIRMEERTSVHLVLEGTQTISINVEGQPTPISVNAEFYAEIFIEEKFAIMLSEHPVEYLTAESTDPVDHLTDTSVTSTTTSTTTSTSTTDTITSSSTSSDDGNGDLPLPVPIVPVLAAMSVVAIFVRKRKY